MAHGACLLWNKWLVGLSLAAACLLAYIVINIRKSEVRAKAARYIEDTFAAEAAVVVTNGFEAWLRAPLPSVILTSTEQSPSEAIVVAVNTAMCRALQRTETELVGTDLLRLVAESHREQTRAAFAGRVEPSNENLSLKEHDGWENPYEVGDGLVWFRWKAPDRSVLPNGHMVAYAEVILR